MTYVELIVVLSIFSILSTVVVFNYNAFQAKIDLKNLASDIALQIVQAQKSSTAGMLPSIAQQALISASWKPSYGVYFNTSGTVKGASTKNFMYFSDLNGDSYFNYSDCTGECISKYTITKPDTISSVSVVGSGTCPQITDLTVVFKRTQSGAIFSTTTPLGTCVIQYAQINITPTSGPSSNIQVYSSGRIQIN